MERLTFEGNFCEISQCAGEYRMTSECEDGACDARKVWERLKEYEDAEQDGRLFISPVKVGDMLWPICWDSVAQEWLVDDNPERVNEVGSKGFFVSADCEEPEAIDEFCPYEEIGETYFRSREEAVESADERNAVICAVRIPDEVRDDDGK